MDEAHLLKKLQDFIAFIEAVGSIRRTFLIRQQQALADVDNLCTDILDLHCSYSLQNSE